MTTSDKIDKIVTNRWLGLPIFAVIMFLVYYISMVTVGSAATDWANDGLFGDGWHLLGHRHQLLRTMPLMNTATPMRSSTAMWLIWANRALIQKNWKATLTQKQTPLTAEAAKDMILNYEKDYNADFSYDVEDEETLEVTTETAVHGRPDHMRQTNSQRVNRIRQIMAYGFRVFRY